jgi:hypothetical protein
MEKTKNLVYAIICSNCGEFYVGETKTELRTRMTVHRQQTRHQDLTILRANEHFHRNILPIKLMSIFKVIIRLIKIFKVIVRLMNIFKVIYHLTKV